VNRKQHRERLRDLRWKKEQARYLVRLLADLGIDQEDMAAVFLRSGPSVSRYVSGQQTLALGALRDLLELADYDPVVLDHWCQDTRERQRLVVVKVPDRGSESPTDVAERVSRTALRLGARIGAVQQAIAEARSPDSPGGEDISHMERAAIRAELRAAQRGLALLDRMLGAGTDNEVSAA